MKKFISLLLLATILSACQNQVINETKTVDKEGNVVKIEHKLVDNTDKQDGGYLVIVGPGLSGYEYYVNKEQMTSSKSNYVLFTHKGKKILIRGEVIKQIPFTNQEELEKLEVQYELHKSLVHK